MIPRMPVDKIKELKVLWKGSGILGGDHSIYGSRLFKIMISRSFSCGLEMMPKFNMLGKESAKAYLKSIYIPGLMQENGESNRPLKSCSTAPLDTFGT